MKITIKVRRFIDEYVACGNAAEAYRRAYNTEKMGEKTIWTKSAEIIKDGQVAAEIAKLQKVTTERTITKVADVLNEFVDIATADVGGIVQYRRLCCRYCYGADHRYQWRDADEFADAVMSMTDTNTQRVRAKLKPLKIPTDGGGYGFKFNRPPAEDCPRCLGEGIPDLFITDTTKLSRAQRRLIAGIKQTQHGVEVKFRDQGDALKSAGQMMGGFKQTLVLENPDGSPINSIPTLPTDPSEVARIYKNFVAGTTESN